MSLWARISDALAALTAGESLAQVFDKLRAPPERSVAFAIAVIALGAKMAKADGRSHVMKSRPFAKCFISPTRTRQAQPRCSTLLDRMLLALKNMRHASMPCFQASPKR